MNVTVSPPSVDELESYLKSNGWAALTSGDSGAMWGNGTRRIALPRTLSHDISTTIVAQLADIEERSWGRTFRAIKYRLFDVTYFRAANDGRIIDAIPINDASRIITDAKNMLRASATTARRERAEIAGSYSALGDAVIRDTLMGHTERGSYVIPIMVPIAEPEEPDIHQPQIDSDLDIPVFHKTQPEPFERRVMRTFAQSLLALNEIVVTPATEPTNNSVHELVYRGVSREFCSALSSILSQRSVAEVETRLEWGSAVQAPGSIPDSIVIAADAADLIDQTAQKLRQNRLSVPRTLTGPIVQLRCDSGEYGDVSISTVYRGKQAEIDVRLPIERYEEAWVWHRAGRAVLVQGTVERGPRRKSQILNPTRFHPLDEMMLPENLDVS